MFADIRNATFNELVDFYFANPYSRKRPSDWYLYIQFQHDPVHNANFFLELFQKSTVLMQKFDSTTINNGIWVISSAAFDGNAYDVILEKRDAPLALKQATVRAMRDLFKDLFAVEPVEASAFWWDRFAGYKRGAAWEAGEPTQLADTIFETLLEILRLDSDYCRDCALDGIRRLRHRNTAEELRSYLRDQKHIDVETRTEIIRVAEANPPFPQI
jgi:hypothetical protein